MPYLVIDLEMTGPEPGWNEIIEVGAVLCDDEWNEIDRYLEQVQPMRKEAFSVRSQRVHDLAWHELQEAPLQNEVLIDFEEWIIESLLPGRKNITELDRKKALRSVLLCGQSVINDINFLRFAYREEKMEWPYSNTLIDLHTLSYFVFEVLKKNGKAVPASRSLSSIAEFFGFRRESTTHNALEDSVLTRLCLQKIFAYSDAMKLEE